MKRKKLQGGPRSPRTKVAQDRRTNLKKLEDELLKSAQGGRAEKCLCQFESNP